MHAGAQSPEELDSLLEDAFVIRDEQALAELFAPGAVVAVTGELREVRGDRIAPAIRAWWAGDLGYVAEPRRVLQADDIALIVADGAISVMHRAADRRWHYAIALLTPDPKGTIR